MAQHSALLVLLVAASGISLQAALLVPTASLSSAAKSQFAGPERIKVETSVTAESDAQDVKEVLHALPAAHPAPAVAASTLATPLVVPAAASSSPPILSAAASPKLPARTGAKANDVSEAYAESERITIQTSVKSESDAQDVKELQHTLPAAQPAPAVAASTLAAQLPVPAPKAAPAKAVHLASEKTLKAQRTNLRNLLSKMKTDIGRFNKDEADDQDQSAGHIEKMQKRLEQDKARLADPKLRPFMRELLQNRTKEEQRDIDFWSHGRKLQKRMYHSNIKITHGLMSRVKGVLQVFDQALVNGKISEEAAQKLKSAVNGVNGLQ